LTKATVTLSNVDIGVEFTTTTESQGIITKIYN
jgi:hypothetical protein